MTHPRHPLFRGAASIAASAALLVLAAGCGPLAGADPSAAASHDLLWSDEFDGAEGGAPDDAIWTPDIGNAENEGWGNDELQYYTDDRDTSRLDGEGHLEITAREADPAADLPCYTVDRCPYVSARLKTEGKASFENGRIDVRARIPNGTGLLPAIWMLGNNGKVWPAEGEIDIAEVVSDEPTTVYGTAHGPGFFNEQGLGGQTELSQPSGDGFHVYSVEKTPERIAWSVDGEEYFELTPDDLPAKAKWPFEQDLHVLLNIAVGGDWPGDPDGTTRFPVTMVVDYVRVYGTGSAPGE